MTGKVFLCKSQSELLGTFTGQSTFIPVFWVEADDIVMGFYFIEVFVLVIVAVQFLTFRCKREWITVQTVQIIFFSQYHNEIVIDAYPNKIVNIHPSLIPAFCGTGYYGLKVHEAALARGVKVVGATVHFVDKGTDTGPIIMQKAVAVQNGDTPKALQQRVMEQAEWKLLPAVIDKIAHGKVHVEDGIAVVED